MVQRNMNVEMVVFILDGPVIYLNSNITQISKLVYRVTVLVLYVRIMGHNIVIGIYFWRRYKNSANIIKITTLQIAQNVMKITMNLIMNVLIVMVNTH